MSYVFFKKGSDGTALMRDTTHESVHEGKSYRAFHNSSSLGDGSTINIYMKTGLVALETPHLIVHSNGSGGYDLDIMEAPTITAATGTSKSVISKNRQKSIASKIINNDASPTANSYSTDVTVTADGTYLGQEVFGNFLNSSDHQYNREFILAPDTEYVIRITSRSAANRVHINLEWYEPV